MKIIKNLTSGFVWIIGMSVLLASCDSDIIGGYGGSTEKYDGSFTGIAGGDSGGSGGDQGGGINTEPGQITAAEWNDLNNWTFWDSISNAQDYSNMDSLWNYNLQNRISVVLKNSSGDAVVNQKVELTDGTGMVLWTSVTDVFGKAELWIENLGPQQPPLGNRIKINGTDMGVAKLFSEGLNEILIASKDRSYKSQIAFVVDATGSMGDEISYLKSELKDVLSKVKQDVNGVAVSTSAVFYRDEGDDYVTRSSDFTSDLNKTIDFIEDQNASGGGDYPEAVHSAMKIALKNLQWNANADSKIIFMLLDAPPHGDNQIITQINGYVKKAAEMGIKIIPVSASGIDKPTEFLLRYFAIATNGTYVFITNDSGIGGDHIEATVGDYQVEFLNELIYRLIIKYIG